MDEEVSVPRASAQMRIQRQEGLDQRGSRGPWSDEHPLNSVENTRFMLFLFFNKFIFNWMIMALQYCVGFCHIST